MMHVDWFLFQGIVFSALISTTVWASMCLVTDAANFCKTPDMCQPVSSGKSKVWERDKILPTWPIAKHGEHDRVPEVRDWRLVRNGITREFMAGECSAEMTSDADICVRGGLYPNASLGHISIR